MIIGLLSLILNFYSVHANPNRGLIIGGSPAPSYDFFAVPQMQNGVLCGSTLVHPDILVTAAHCAALFEDEVFYIGASKIDGSDAIDTIGVQEIRIHPEFDLQGLEDEMNGFVQVGSASLLHDIALIKLQSESKATPAEWNSGPGWVQPGDSVKVVGFGSDENGSIPYYLVEVNVEVVDEYICERIYDGFSEIVGDLQICAGKTDAGACVGDSGGPLLYNDVLIGVVSFGLILEDGSCESGNFPDVYTRTSGYAEFIESGICDLSGVPPASCQSGIQSNAPTWHFSKLPTLFPMVSLSKTATYTPSY
jgi:trypsin